MESEPDSLVNDNGNCDAEIVDSKLKNTIDVVEGSQGSLGKTELSLVGSIGLSLTPSQTPVTKGKGLKKWRRIRRESGNEMSNNFDSNRKRGMTALPVGVKPGEGSSSSTNAMSNVVGNALDHIALYGDLSERKGDFGSRADSENSRSSTAASGPRGNRVFNSNVKNTGTLVQSNDRQEKGNIKKARGGRIKKEHSISSVESDSRSSNFVFLQADHSMTSNGRVNGRSGKYDEDDSDDARNGGSVNYPSQTMFGKNDADYENVSHEWSVKEEKIDDHVESGDLDPLVDSIIPLQLAQEALEREVEKLRDVGKEDLISSDEADLQSKIEEAFNTLELKNTKISEIESTINSTKLKTEYEELLTQRIAAEVEYLVISNTVQNLKAGHMGRMNLAVDQKNVSAAALPPEEDDAEKVKSRVWRYVCCLIVQLVLLLVVLYVVVLKFSSKTVEVIPT